MKFPCGCPFIKYKLSKNFNKEEEEKILSTDEEDEEENYHFLRGLVLFYCSGEKCQESGCFYLRPHTL